MSIAARLEKYSMPVTETGCWLWCGASLNAGYGLMWAHGRNELAHRLAYEVAFGAIPKGLHVLHKCDTPACINPSHLFVGTRSDNMQDMMAKGRRGDTALRGEANHFSKLTESDVSAIRVEYARGGISQRNLAAKRGLDELTIYRIVNRKSWKHVA